ncbi:MAG: Sec-independent protein translocase TatA [Sphingobacterium sp.]|jgi:sec-independent protein translocase protein TatA|uniref:twin-arginine translocase TatA/TatE family subunit n=1 Tax=unclassified Sphingobacterium TaxID=2609468 RepID=UPI0009D2B8D8|nr:twin-arginine translocase TatA/TatE family subunit [Sphingobacterium sp. CZ-UAM]MDF2518926.1 Sec-independent protein translocase TatA [Sphingobacterium sp.]OOG17225.1 Sec-independent protein translocase TatA [Sphingobacterium sp. CZ-UAM]
MSTSFLIMGLGANEIILIVIALLLLFGGKKIPELMRGLGKGVKEFKEGQKEDSSAEKKPEVEDNK